MVLKGVSGKSGFFFIELPIELPIEFVFYTHFRAHETGRKLVCRLLLEKKKRHPVDDPHHSSDLVSCCCLFYTSPTLQARTIYL